MGTVGLSAINDVVSLVVIVCPSGCFFDGTKSINQNFEICFLETNTSNQLYCMAGGCKVSYCSDGKIASFPTPTLRATTLSCKRKSKTASIVRSYRLMVMLPISPNTNPE